MKFVDIKGGFIDGSRTLVLSHNDAVFRANLNCQFELRNFYGVGLTTFWARVKGTFAALRFIWRKKT